MATIARTGSGTSGATAGKPFVLVAASSASSEVKSSATYVCDGVNDQVEINAALAGGSKYVQLSEGAFNIGSSPIRVTSRSTLNGYGRATRLVATATITGGGTDTAYDFGWGGIVESFDVQTHRTTVTNLEIDGTYKNCHGIYYRTTGISDVNGTDAWNQFGAEGFDAVHYFDNLYVHETLGHAYHLEGHGGMFFTNCRAWGNGSNTQQASGWYVSVIDSFFTNCESGACAGGHAWEIVDANNHFANCKGWYAKKNGFNISAEGVRNTFVGCVAQDNTQHGWYLAAGPTSLAGCGADSNSYDGSPSTAITGASYNGFVLDATSQAQLSACWATDKNEGSRGRRQQYGYQLTNTPSKCIVTGSGHNNAVGPVTGGGRLGADNTVQVTAAGATHSWLANGGRLYQPVLATAPTDADIPVSGMSAWLDQSTNVLTFRIRKSDGTYITKTL